MKIYFKKLKNSAKNFPKALADKSFLSSIILIFLALVVGAILFYKYDVLVEKQEAQSSQTSLRIQQANYSFVMSEWQERQEKFDAADFKNWPDPFSFSGLTR